MKRKLAISGATIALAVPALAFAGGGVKTNYEGHLVGAPDSAVKLKESFGDLERAVKVFTVRDYDGPVPGRRARHAQADEAHGHEPGRQGRRLQVPRQQRTHDGQAPGHIGRNKATGTFRITGRLKAENGQTLDCDSGKLDWIAAALGPGAQRSRSAASTPASRSRSPVGRVM